MQAAADSIFREFFSKVIGVTAGAITAVGTPGPWAPAAGLWAGESFERVYKQAYDDAKGWAIRENIGGKVYDKFHPDNAFNPGRIDPQCKADYDTSRAFKTPDFNPRRDPLTLDLDGDGLETVGIEDSNVFFDHDADGIKTKTGWIAPDDALLVIDRNGDGIINSGRELFGDSTLLPTGATAADGIAALAAEDTNGDGRVDNQDTNWANLRLWQDANQDGISQADELTTLDSKSIVAINTSRISNSVFEANGNQIADLGTYVKSDGTTGTVGEVIEVDTEGSFGDINLGEDTFHREFSDTIPLHDDVKGLPDMGGSGLVRDLRQAASIDSAAGLKLRDLLTQYTAAPTKAAQHALLDQLIDAWAETAGAQFGALKAGVDSKKDETHTPILTLEEDRLITVAAIFNGVAPSVAGSQMIKNIVSAWDWDYSSQSGWYVSQIWYTTGLYPEQRAALQKSVDSLSQSVYDSLLLQTRLKPVLDAVNLDFSSGGVNLDFNQARQILNERMNVDPINGLIDLVEFTKATDFWAVPAGWDGYQRIAQTIQSFPSNLELSIVLSELNINAQNTSSWNDGKAKEQSSIVIGAEGNEILHGNNGDDGLLGDQGNDTLYGGNGADSLYGGAGEDNLYGDAGNDILEGGTGNDQLSGGTGNNVYVFGRGDGQDKINYTSDTSSTKLNVLQFRSGVLPSEVIVSRSDVHLVLSIAGTSDKITLDSYFYNDDPFNIWNPVQQVSFDDGTTWNVATLTSKAFAGTNANDNLVGTLMGDVIAGQIGADTLRGRDGNDTLIGGEDNDSLYGENGNDVLEGGEGNDALTGGGGSDVFRFSSSNHGMDTLTDFISGADKLEVVGSNFGLSAGMGITLVSGSATPVASGNNAQFLYNTTSGALFFDQDGGGSTYSMVQIATLTGSKTLAASDIMVV